MAAAGLAPVLLRFSEDSRPLQREALFGDALWVCGLVRKVFDQTWHK